MLTPDQEKLKEAALAAIGKVYSSKEREVFDWAATPAAILAILAQLEQVQGWRDLATSKPPEGVQVLIALDTGNVVTGFRFSAGWHWDETDCEADADATATHYQPLPPPPEAA